MIFVFISELNYDFNLYTANEDTPQLYMCCGRGPRSSLRVLRHGLEVSEMAVSELPGNPNAVWTVKRRADGKNTRTNTLLFLVLMMLYSC